jgi:lipid A 3-O-deacylase
MLRLFSSVWCYGVLVILLLWYHGNGYSGLVITVENDSVLGSDNNYSHGTELEWVGDIILGEDDETEQVGYGIHQLIYTPMDITIAGDQPNDRPWSGLTTAFRETWKFSEAEDVRSRIEVGVLGPSAMSEESQTWFHDITGNRKPMGWDNQLPDEPVLNYYHERRHPLLGYGADGPWRFFADAIYGGTVGTVFINGMGGVVLRAGWNVPPRHIPTGIGPKLGQKGPYVYAIGETDGMLVLHNATISDSLFRKRDPGVEQKIERAVGTYRYGVVAGYGGMSISYTMNERSNEFEGQEKTMDWGTITMEFVRRF